MLSFGLSALSFAALAAAQQNTNTLIAIPANLSTKPLHKDVYGYSLEPVWVEDYVSSDLATNLMSVLTEVIGKPPPWRVGGNTADQTYMDPELSEPSLSSPNASAAKTFNITPEWFDSWADYFPEGTDLLFTLNFNDYKDDWATAVAQAEAVHEALGDKLTLLELGNEIDHFGSKGWRGESWGVFEYIEQWRNASKRVIESDWYKNAKSPPKFQAAVFADPPWVPDQHDELDDLDIINITKAGLVDDIIETYSVHMYPQSTCDSERWHRMSLDLLSNHTVVWLNISQYAPQVAAANNAGASLILGETNSISCSGRSGISDTFGGALWNVDYVLQAASIGLEKIYFHLGANSEYSSFTPLPYEYKGENLTAGIRAPFYSHYFIGNIVAGTDNYSIAALPGANASDLSGYGVYGSSKTLQKLVFLDMGVWNTTSGLSNPSTLSDTDSKFRSNGTRPERDLQVRVGWKPNTKVKVTRLSGPGTNAKSNVTVSGITFDPETGSRVGDEEKEELSVDGAGTLSFQIPRAGAVLLEIADGAGGSKDDDESTVPPPNGSSRLGTASLWMSLVAGLFLML